MNDFNGIILIDKPENFTSFDVVAKMRGILHMKKIGHTGTLDPMATGVLPVMVGRATKALGILPESGKKYIADFHLGFETNTQDITGEVVKKSDLKIFKQDILNILNKFRGNIKQLPPMYSAVSVNGTKLYKLARKGITVERKARDIEISELELVDFNEDSQCGKLEIACSGGTYVRTLINDIGEKLGTFAVMTGLRRTMACGFDINNCITLEKLQELADCDKINDAVIPIEKIFSYLPKIHLDGKQKKMYCNGVRLDIARIAGVLPDEDYYAVYSGDDIFIGTAKINREKNEFCSDKFFNII